MFRHCLSYYFSFSNYNTSVTQLSADSTSVHFCYEHTLYRIAKSLLDRVRVISIPTAVLRSVRAHSYYSYCGYINHISV